MHFGFIEMISCPIGAGVQEPYRLVCAISVPSDSDAASRCLAIVIGVILQRGIARHLFLNPSPEDSPSNEELFERWADSSTLPALTSDDPHFGRGICKSGTAATSFLGHFRPPQHDGIWTPRVFSSVAFGVKSLLSSGGGRSVVQRQGNSSSPPLPAAPASSHPQWLPQQN